MHFEMHPEALQASSQARALSLGDAAKTSAVTDMHLLALLAEKLPEVEHHVELALSGILGLPGSVKRPK